MTTACICSDPAMPRNFGWDRVKLSEHSYADINRLREAVEKDPASANPEPGLYLYSKQARRKLEALAWAVFYKQREDHSAASAAA